MRAINTRLLLGLLAAVAVSVATIQIIHVVQVQRNAAQLLRQADNFQKNGRLDRSEMFLERYLAFQPNDTNVLSRYGQLVSKTSSREAREKAIMVLEKVLRVAPDRKEDRRKLASLALELERYLDARQHAEMLLNPDGKDAEANYILGCCEDIEGKYAPAEQCYRKSIAGDASDLRPYVRLAQMLRTKLNEATKADRVMDDLVAAQARSFKAFLVRCRYRSQYEIPGAEQDALRALELAPDDANAILFAANHAGKQKDWARARGYLKRGLKLHAQDPRMYLYTAEIELGAGRRDAAEQVLVQGAEALPDVDELKWQLAKAWIDGGKGRRAIALLKLLDDNGFEPERVKLLRALLTMGHQDWEEAAKQLEAIRPVFAPEPELARLVDGYLARCYERQRKATEVRQVYQRILNRLTPTKAKDLELLGPTLVAYGRALESLGYANEALEQYGAWPDTQLAIAELLIRRNANLPAAEQRWDEVERTLNEAARRDPASPQVPILRATILVARGDFARAQAALEEARTARPDQLELWLALAALHERRGAIGAIPPLLDAAEKRLGDRVELRLARARVVSLQGGGGAAKALDALARDLDQRPTAEQEQLLRGLADARQRIGDRAGALAVWEKLVVQAPDDLVVQTLAFEFAELAGDDRAMLAALDQIRDIEGDQGPFFQYVTASHLIWKAEHGDKARLDEARRFLANAAAKRPGWPSVLLAMARLDVLGGNTAAALDHQVQAIEAGGRDPAVIRSVLEQLYQLRRFTDASKVLAKLQDSALLSGQFQRYAAEISVRYRDLDRALDLAQNAVAADSKDYRDQVWLGQMLAVTGQRPEAEKHLRLAVALAGDDPAPRITLISFLISIGRTADAEEATHETEQRFAPEKYPLPLARCHEEVGHSARALDLYRAALAAAPDNEAALRHMIDFLIKTNRLREAEPHLEHLIALRGNAPDVPDLEAVLAKVSSQVDPDRLRKALELVSTAGDAGSAAADEPADQVRYRATVLANINDEPRRRQAIGLLEGLFAREKNPADRFKLAQLYEQQGEWPKAKEALLALCRSSAKTAAMLATLVQDLIRHGEANEAGPWLDTLEQLEPRVLRTVQLRAQLFKALGQGDRAVALLEEFAGRGAQVLPAAQTLEGLEQFAAAETLFRAAADKNPKAKLMLAMYLGRRGRLPEAFDVCEASWTTCPPEDVARTCVTLLYSPKADDSHRSRVESWLQKALAQQPDANTLLLPLAEVRHLQSRYAESESTYRQALARDQSNVSALNNLAWLLAHVAGKEQEALDLIGRAIAAAGPVPPLLDTRGTVHLSMGQVDQAIKDIEDAVAGDPKNAQIRLHLARAYEADGRSADTSAAFAQAVRLGLEPATLDPLDRPDYQRLTAAVSRK